MVPPRNVVIVCQMRRNGVIKDCDEMVRLLLLTWRKNLSGYTYVFDFKGCVIKEKLIQLKVHCKRLILLLKTLHLLPLAADCFLRPVGIRLANTTATSPLLCCQDVRDKSDLFGRSNVTSSDTSLPTS